MNRQNTWLQHIVLPLVVFGVMVLIKLRAESSHAVELIVAVTGLIALINAIAEAHVDTAVFLFSSRFQMATAMLGFSGFMSMVLAPPTLTLSSAIVNQLLVGTLVGIAIRNRFLASCEQRRTGEATDAIRLQLALAIGLIVFLFPVEDQTVGVGSAFVLGVGCGFFIHFTARRGEQLEPRRLKLKARIESALADINARPLKPLELTAVRLLAKRRWRKLKTLMSEQRDAMTFGLALIKATSERIHGDNPRAVQTLQRELSRQNRTANEEDNLAYLVLAVSYRDLGEYALMRECLDKAEHLEPRCFFLCILKALSIAEDLSTFPVRELKDLSGVRAEIEHYFDQAFATKRHHVSILAAVAACALPITRRFLDDTYAYSLLKTGRMTVSKTLLEACLREDSRSASTHLHLAEWYFTVVDGGGSEEDLERAERAGNFCLRMALAHSRTRDSHTRRRAQKIANTRRQIRRCDRPLSTGSL